MAKSRILVVEDDADIANMLKIYFDSQGYQTYVAGEGLQALEFCRRTPPNLVILDIRLPDIDGYEICRVLRSTLRTSHIPILFLTQKDDRTPVSSAASVTRNLSVNEGPAGSCCAAILPPQMHLYRYVSWIGDWLEPAFGVGTLFCLEEVVESLSWDSRVTSTGWSRRGES